MKRILVGRAVVALVALPVACNLFGPDQSVVLDVTRIDAPATISSGATLTVVLNVTVGGCKMFDHIAVERGTSSASLTAWGRDAAKGRSDIGCPAFIANEPHSYRFDPPFQSPFTLEVDRVGLPPLSATVQVQ